MKIGHIMAFVAYKMQMEINNWVPRLLYVLSGYKPSLNITCGYNVTPCNFKFVVSANSPLRQTRLSLIMHTDLRI